MVMFKIAMVGLMICLSLMVYNKKGVIDYGDLRKEYGVILAKPTFSDVDREHMDAWWDVHIPVIMKVELNILRKIDYANLDLDSKKFIRANLGDLILNTALVYGDGTESDITDVAYSVLVDDLYHWNLYIHGLDDRVKFKYH